LTSPTRLQLIKPVVVQGHYNRQQPDTANPVTYYLSDSTGTIGRTGTLLWWSYGNAKRIVARNISLLSFDPDEASATKALEITVEASNNTGVLSGNRKTVTTSLTERVVYLRNN
jgi:hypothetical protein